MALGGKAVAVTSTPIRCAACTVKRGRQVLDQCCDVALFGLEDSAKIADQLESLPRIGLLLSDVKDWDSHNP